MFLDAAGELFGGWVAATNDVNQYWAIDFLETHRVLEVMIQGREDAEMWVESFKLQYLNDSGVFTEYTDNTNSSVSICIAARTNYAKSLHFL